jgi:hypothetical protein
MLNIELIYAEIYARGLNKGVCRAFRKNKPGRAIGFSVINSILDHN